MEIWMEVSLYFLGNFMGNFLRNFNRILAKGQLVVQSRRLTYQTVTYKILF